jgi:CRISPR type IV-associated protein Csf3
MSYEPLRITAVLGSPYQGDPAAPIDGILAYLSHVRAFGELPAQLPGQAPEVHPEVVPLKVVNEGADWFFAASFALWPEQVAFQRDHWNKRFDVVEAEQYTDSKKVQMSEGRYKPYHYSISLRHATSVQWCVMGDGAAITELLAECSAIGKKRSQGFGVVTAWHVEPCQTDESILSASGTPVRTIPLSWWSDAYPNAPLPDVTRRTIRPNYWDNNNYRMCVKA